MTAARACTCFAQAVRCRRRHQPRRPPLAKIRPGRPVPTTGFSARGTASLRRFCSCIVPNYLDRQGLAMSEREQSEDQTESLSLWANERAGQQRFAGRIMKSPREVLIRPIVLSLAAILLTSLVVAEAYSHAK